jgi:putative component of toxin-antitoxin plasmid stabilization module
VKEIAETYTYNGNWYHASVMEFADTNTATQGISKLKEAYNPGMIILDKKYVNYVDLGNKYNFYFYQSGKYILVLDMTGEKGLADSFVIWYYSKYSNQ